MMKTQSAVELSLYYFRTGLYCSEAMLRAFNEFYCLGLDDNSYKIATGFGSGIGESGCSCGALTAGVMILGLVSGRNSKSGSEKIVYKAVKQLHDEFRSQNKSACCRVLTKSVVWGSKEHKKLCENYVESSAAIVDSILKKYLFEYLPEKQMRISIIIPLAPNEEITPALVDMLEALSSETEIIYIRSNGEASGRAKCLNAGAAVAVNQQLLFLHADSYFLPEAYEKLKRSVIKTPNALHYFDLSFYDGPWTMKLNQWGVMFRCKVLKTPFGDQGFSINKELFNELGGFPANVPYGEDHILVRRAKSKSVPVISIKAPIFTSARKYINNGWLKTSIKHLYLWRLQAYKDKHR